MAVISQRESKTHRCYGCNEIFSRSECPYECMCFHGEDDEAHYRGVCLPCTRFFTYYLGRDWTRLAYAPADHGNHRLVRTWTIEPPDSDWT